MAYGYYNPYQQINPNIYNQQRLMEQQMFQQPQMQPQQQVQNGLSGRMVGSVSEINASEVSMTSEPSVFVKSDLSEIYLKRWNQNGTIDTNIYKIQIEQPKETKNTDMEETLLLFAEQLSTIEDKLNKVLEKPSTTQKGGAH